MKNQNASLSQEVCDLNENTSFKNSCSSCENLLKENDFLKESNSCFQNEKELLKERILELERDNNVLKENASCSEM